MSVTNREKALIRQIQKTKEFRPIGAIWLGEVWREPHREPGDQFTEIWVLKIGNDDYRTYESPDLAKGAAMLRSLEITLYDMPPNDPTGKLRTSNGQVSRAHSVFGK